MPSRNAVKLYVENGYYHIYNRGVDKREIFTDKKDYTIFLGLLRRYLVPPENENELDGKSDMNNRNKIVIETRSDLVMIPVNHGIGQICIAKSSL